MPAGSSTIASFFANPQSSHGRSVTADAELERAIKLSEAEARLSSLDEDELLQQALEASRAEMDDAAKRSRMEDAHTPVKRHKSSAEAIEKADTTDTETELDFAEESFGEKEEIINRLNGSLDLVYCKGWIRWEERVKLREWMLKELTWHRVSYTSLRTKQKIITPRFTATFGKDDTGAPDSVYPVKPKAIPSILEQLRLQLEKKTGAHFNTIIVNYYKDGKDSISYHADDETFLGPLPTIASLSLGSSRDFYIRRKFATDAAPPESQFYTKGSGPAASRLTEKMQLDDGDLLVMKGRTQADWEHSLVKRLKVTGGRINLTFRKVVSVKGTNNFQRYNRGLPTDDETQTYRWDAKKGAMLPGIGGI